MDEYEAAHLELCDRVSELADALAEHRRDSLMADAEMRRVAVADLKKWIETIDGILLGYTVGA